MLAVVMECPCGWTSDAPHHLPPLGEIRPWIMLFITMVLGQVFDVEDVANVVLVTWDVDLIGIVVVAC